MIVELLFGHFVIAFCKHLSDRCFVKPVNAEAAGF